MPEQFPIGAGFSEGELKFASFWVRNKRRIRVSIFASLIAINVIFWGYAGWGLIDAYIISYPVESKILQDIANNQFLAQELQSNHPKSIKTGQTVVFASSENRYDMIVPVENPNTEWYAEFTYRFNVGGDQTPKKRGFIMPNASVYLGAYGFTPTRQGSKSAVLTVDDIQWKRVDPAMVDGNFSEWMSRRDAFEISDIVYKDDISTGKKKISRTTFTFTNPTAYGYWEVGVYIILLRASTPVASTFITVSDVGSGTSRPISVDWYESLPGVTETIIAPVVNFFDKEAYLPTSRF